MGIFIDKHDAAELESLLKDQFRGAGCIPVVTWNDWECIHIKVFPPIKAKLKYCLAHNTISVSNGLQSLISHDLWVRDGYKNMGIAQAIMRAKLAWIDRRGWPLIARISDANKIQQHILEKYGWKNIGEVWAYTPKPC